MKAILARYSVVVGILFHPSLEAKAEPARNVRNDNFNNVPCAGYSEYFTQVDVDCVTWIGDINISNNAGILINKHHNLTCPALNEAINSLSRRQSINIKDLFVVMNDNEKIAANAFKQCDANTAAKAQFNELAAFDQIDKIIAEAGNPDKGDSGTRDQVDSAIDASPYSEKIKKIAKVVNIATDPKASENIKQFAEDLYSHPFYTPLYTAAQAGNRASNILDLKDLANRFSPVQYPTTNQERQVSNLVNGTPKRIVNYITTVFP